MWYCYLLSNQQKQIFGSEVLYADPMYSINTPFMNYSIRNQMNYLENHQNVPVLITLNETLRNDMVSLPSVQNCFGNENTREALPKQKKSKAPKSIKPISPKKKIIKKLDTKSTSDQNESRGEIGRNPGRNSTSNIFRVFIKLCSKGKFETILKEKFMEISKLNSFFISFEYFKLRVKELAPSTSNYINVKEFKKACEGTNEFSKAFRRLFHWFVNNYAINHSLTLKGKHCMMKESIKCFLSNLHNIEGDLWKQQYKETVTIDDECQRSVSTY